MYCIVCGKHIKFENPKISYIFEKTVLSITCIIVAVKMKRYLKKKNE